MPTALITGASRGLGAALAHALAERDWTTIVTARSAPPLLDATSGARSSGRGHAVPGDVGDPQHRAEVAALVASLGGVDLIVNNASDLGATPLPALVTYPLDRLAGVLHTNVVAPLALIQALLPHLRAGAAIVNVTSDAAVEAYAGWGGYGASKAALEQLSKVLAVELPEFGVYAFDPGDMRTQMHQDAYPGEDISDRPAPESVVPALLTLIDSRPVSGRYTAAAFLAAVGGSR